MGRAHTRGFGRYEGLGDSVKNLFLIYLGVIMSDFEEIQRLTEEMMEKLEEDDQKARENDTLVGRFFYLPVADGRAYYQVTDVDGNKVKVEHFDHEMNDYKASYLGDGKWIDKGWVKDKLKQKEKLKDLFS